jgi:glutathione S-transferase
MTGPAITVLYFPVQGRAEVVRLALAAAGVEFVNEDVDRSKLKVDFDTFPFGQAPILKVGDLVIPQSLAQLRYVGRKYDLYGSSIVEATYIDVLLDGINDIDGKLGPLVREGLTEVKKAQYWTATAAPETIGERNGGAHWTYISNIVKKTGKGYSVGAKPSIADIALYHVLNKHFAQVYSAQKFAALYPELAAIHKAVSELPAIVAYHASPLSYK